MKKRILSMMLTACMLSSLMVFAPAGTVEAAETITDEALFMTYPTYLSNSEMDEGLSKAEAAYYAVLNSYSKTDEGIAVIMSALSEGISVYIKDKMGQLGMGENLYEEYAKDAAATYMKSILSNSSAIKKATKTINTAYKTLKTSYKVGEAIDKTRLLTDLRKLAADYDIHISVEGMDKVVNKLYDTGDLKEEIDAIGEADELWKYVLEFTELQAIENTTIDMLIDELKKSGQADSDLYLGLTLLKKEIDLNEAEYVLKKYSNSKVVGYISKNIDKFFYSLAGGSNITVIAVTSFTKLFADYVYVDAKADDITKAIMQTSFISSLDICLSQYRTKFLQGTATTEDIESYENLYAAYLSAYKACLDSCYDVAKLDDKYTLGGDCMVWADEIEYTYTYDTYIRWCKEEVAHDIENSTLDKNNGSSTITDELNEETIKSRFERIYKLYPPNSDKKFTGEYDGAKHSMGFVAKVFSMLFDKQMSNKVDSKYNYILTSNKNVRVVGWLEEENVTVSNLKELFSDARIGDVILTSGQYDYFQGMILTDVTETGIEVYDCDSECGPEKDDYYDLIQQYELTYEWMADAFSKNGVYYSKPGISIYRAIRKISNTSSDNSLNNEEYDDSINYVIEDGILTAYKGLRTTIEIPDGVTKIATDCFMNDRTIKKVYMPDSVTTIEMQAFSGCINLEYIKLSNNLTAIEYGVFEECSSLNSIYIPKKVSYIGGHAFYHTNLNTISIPGNVKTLYGGCFAACGLTKLYMEEGIERIHSNAFWECPINNDIVIPDTVIQLGGSVFDGVETCCFYIGAGVTECSWSFGDMKHLEYIDVSEENKYFKAIDGILYDRNVQKLICVPKNKKIEVFTIPDGVTEIYSFSNNPYIKEVKIPDSVEIIGNSAFENCEMLSSVILPNKYIKIYSFAFQNTPLRKNNIVDGIFYLDEYLVDVDNRYDIPRDLFIRENTKYICSLNGGYYDLESKEFSFDRITFPDSVIKIDESAFNGCAVKKIYTNSNLREIPDYAFAFCDDLEEITLHEGLEYIGYGAFEGCAKLKEINIPTTVKTIRSYAFRDCDNLVSVIINSNNFESQAFQDCDNIENVIICDNVTDLSKAVHIFDGCNKLKNISFGNSLKNIPMNFTNSSALTELYVPSNIEIIYNSAFENCIKLKKIMLDEGVKEIRGMAFRGCKSLTEIYVPRSLYRIDGSVFENCNALTDVYYNGTTDDWRGISINKNNNDCLFNATIHFVESNNELDTQVEIIEYPYEPMSGEINSYYDIDYCFVSVGDKCYMKVSSNNYYGKYALMDVETGKLVLDNINDRVIAVSKNSDVIAYTSGNGKCYIYNTKDEAVICELKSLGSIGNYDSYSDTGFIAHLASDDKLHFVSNDGSVGEAIEFNYDLYTDEQNPDVLWEHIGDGCYYLGVGKQAWNYMDKRIGIMTSDGKFISDIYSYGFDNGYGIVENSGKYGVIDNIGDYIIPCQYDYIGSYFDGSYVCCQNGVYGVLGSTGNIIIPFEYDDICSDHWLEYEAYICSKNGKYGILDNVGNVIIPLEYDTVEFPDMNNLFICSKNGKKGAVSGDGNLVIPFEYDNIIYSVDIQLYECIKNGVYYGINADGNIQFTYTPDYDVFDEVSYILGNGLAVVYNTVLEDGLYINKFGIVNFDNEIVIPITYSDFGGLRFVEDLCCIGLIENSGSSYGYIDINGNTIIPFEYDYALDFSGGMAPVCKDGKYGYIDKNNNIVIPFEYDFAQSFSEGLALVRKRDKYGFIDNDGNLIIPFIYQDATSFYDGKAEVWYDYNIPSVLINKNNEIIYSESDIPLYSLTGEYDYLNGTYTGGVKINKTGQIIDISELKILPIIVGKNGEYIVAFSEDFEKAYKLNIKYNDSADVSISDFNVSNIGETATLNAIVLGNISSDTLVYLASYDSSGKLLELQTTTLLDGIAQATLSTKDVDKFKVFVWRDNIKPLCEAKECKLQQ